MPAAASTTPSYSSVPDFSMRVPTLPRMGMNSKSGRRAFSCATLRGLLVPNLAPAGRSSKGRPQRSTMTSLASCLSVKAAIVRPAGRSAGRSLALWTAKSISPDSRAASMSLTNMPLSMLKRGSVLLRSPIVDRGTISNLAFGCTTLSRLTTSSV